MNNPNLNLNNVELYSEVNRNYTFLYNFWTCVLGRNWPIETIEVTDHEGNSEVREYPVDMDKIGDSYVYNWYRRIEQGTVMQYASQGNALRYLKLLAVYYLYY